MYRPYVMIGIFAGTKILLFLYRRVLKEETTLEQMLADLKRIEEEAKTQFEQVENQEALNDLRVKYLGKKGELTAILKGMGKLSGEDRPKVGQVANEIRQALEEVLAAKTKELKESALKAQIES